MKKDEKGRKLARRYPWTEWLSLARFSLLRGRDYDCQPHGMGQMVRNRAFQKGLRAEVHIREGGRIDVTLSKEGLDA